MAQFYCDEGRIQRGPWCPILQNNIKITSFLLKNNVTVAKPVGYQCLDLDLRYKGPRPRPKRDFKVARLRLQKTCLDTSTSFKEAIEMKYGSQQRTILI